MNAPIASVVVPLYNDAATIQACLGSLLAQTIASRLEIIVVNDGSRDDGAALARGLPVKVLDQPNRGPAAARNAGARAARGPVVLFLDADCVAPAGWAQSLLAPFSSPDIVAAVGAIDSATPEPLPRLTQLEIEERYAKLSRAREVDFFASVAFAVRRGHFVGLGGFREDFLYNEDVELAYRIHRGGGRMVFVPEVRVLHPHPQRWRDYARTKFWRGVWRMRVYRLYPEKARADSWTPQGLKVQIAAFCALPPLLAFSIAYPAAAWLGLALAAAGLHSGMAIIVGGWRAGGPALGALAVPFLVVRAWSLGTAVLWSFLSRERPGAAAMH